MKFFWDTSAAINAAISPTAAKRLDSGDHCARVHLFSEFFSTMTGRGIPSVDANGQPVRVVFDADEAAKWLRTFADRVTLIELDGRETLDGLDAAQARNVQGARVYDYAHALAAIKADADVVLTRNEKHFEGLTGMARIEWP
jgi:hypothetical protein